MTPSLKDIESISTILGSETVFKGTMKFSKPLKIDGKYEGRIESEGFLYIEEGAEVRADIQVGSIVVGGIVYGDIEASEKLEMLSTGQVIGNIRTAKLKIADGVRFEGKCDMISDPESINVFSAPVEQLKQDHNEI